MSSQRKEELKFTLQRSRPGGQNSLGSWVAFLTVNNAYLDRSTTIKKTLAMPVKDYSDKLTKEKTHPKRMWGTISGFSGLRSYMNRKGES